MNMEIKTRQVGQPDGLNRAGAAGPATAGDTYIIAQVGLADNPFLGDLIEQARAGLQSHMLEAARQAAIADQYRRMLRGLLEAAGRGANGTH